MVGKSKSIYFCGRWAFGDGDVEKSTTSRRVHASGLVNVICSHSLFQFAGLVIGAAAAIRSRTMVEKSHIHTQ
jgi:hypothetical protein